MTPFRSKPVKWDGKDENGRYKNKGGYKYDIVMKTVVNKAEDMPKCFLADTPEEAEAIFARFEKILNNFAYAYAVSTTSLNKSDLFGEALIGLARAYRDWDPSRSDDFKIYAIYHIKDALSEFVRTNASSVSVPAYIKKTNSNLQEIKNICERAGISYSTVVKKQELPDELRAADAVRCAELVKNLINAANRAKVDYLKFIERISLIPTDVEFKDQTPTETHIRETEMFEAAMIVEKLKEHMEKDELTICEGIMLDKSYEQIGSEMGRSKGWVSEKLKALRERIISKMESGTL